MVKKPRLTLGHKMAKKTTLINKSRTNMKRLFGLTFVFLVVVSLMLSLNTSVIIAGQSNNNQKQVVSTVFPPPMLKLNNNWITAGFNFNNPVTVHNVVQQKANNNVNITGSTISFNYNNLVNSVGTCLATVDENAANLQSMMNSSNNGQSWVTNYSPSLENSLTVTIFGEFNITSDANNVIGLDYNLNQWTNNSLTGTTNLWLNNNVEVFTGATNANIIAAYFNIGQFVRLDNVGQDAATYNVAYMNTNWQTIAANLQPPQIT